MIIRCSLKCVGCKSKITLRLQIGIDAVQPFYFVCQKCGAPIKGVNRIDYEKDPPGIDLNLEGTEIRLVDWKKPEQTITIAPDLPCAISSNENPASPFPFIYQSKLMENDYDLLEFQRRIGLFRDGIQTNWPKYRRLTSYYLDRNWKLFDKEIRNIFRKKVNASATELYRHDLFETASTMFFAYIQPNLNYIDLLEEVNYFINDVAAKNINSLSKFVNLIEDKELVSFQTKLLERLSFMVDNFPALSAGLPIVFYNNSVKSNLNEIRIMRDDFDILKSHYLSCFEISHKVLKLLVGMINVFLRGDADIFQEDKPKSLESFTKLPNAQKLKFLDANVLPEISSQWNICFDRKIRNAIGHYGIRHDLRTGMLVQDDEGISIPYSEFVLRNLELLPLLQFCLHVVKKMYAIKFFLG